MKPGERYWSLVDPIWEAVSIYDGPDVFLRQFQRSDGAARTLLAAHWCQSEIRNGGFHQFFSNSTGVLAPEAASAFYDIGMPLAGKTIEEAMAWFGDSYPRDRAARQAQLQLFTKQNPDNWDPFRKLDDAVFDLFDEENGGFDVAADRYAERQG
jgi:hypothetical protein